MSDRKCSACGQTTKGEVPFCSNCGALFPVSDEKELMRQAVGYSFDLKWVLLGAIVSAALQFGLLAGLWSVWGSKILVGEKGRSLLEVNLDAVSPDWGPDSGGTRVTLRIKPDNKKINVATKVVSVSFGGVKAQPFHIQHLKVVQAECNQHCANQLKAQKIYRECMKGCDEAELKTDAKKLQDDLKPCADLAEKKDKGEFKKPEDYNNEFKRLKCAEHTRTFRAFQKRKERCDDICPKKKKSMDAETGRCRACRARMPLFVKRAELCKKQPTSCWAYMDKQDRSPLPKAPDFSKIKDPKKRKEAREEFDKARRETIAANKRRAEREAKQLRTVVNVYTPKVPGKIGYANISILFASGEKLTRHSGYYFVKPKVRQKPKIEKVKRTRHDPVRTTGFWILLVFSCLFYLAGGFVVGRLSPGIGNKEPLVAALLGWLLFEIALVLIGTAGTAQLFTIFIGLPAFIGCAIIGAILAERSLGFG